MANVRRVEMRGDQLVLHFDDKSKVLAYPTQGNNWLVKKVVEPVDPGDGGAGGGGANGITLVDPLPGSVSAKDTEGTTWNLNAAQVKNAADIIKACAGVKEAANRDVIRIVLITALVESVLRIYANTRVYPETANYPHEADASDSDSVGLFQQRPSVGWGTPKNCMLTDYSTKAFLGIGESRNPGLFDLSNWQGGTPGRAAQRVQGSAFPARYDVQVPVANALMDALIKPAPSGGGGGGSGEWQWPFQYSRFVAQSGYLGQMAQFNPARKNPVTGIVTAHQGIDFGVGGISGMVIPAAHAGTVEISASASSPYFGYGAAILIRHADGTACLYAHRVRKELNVGDKVTKGQRLGLVGATGRATGPHLHWETWEKGNVKVDPRKFMAARGVKET